MSLLVVLDLNGTILDSTHHRRVGVTEDARARAKYVYYRPHMKSFLQWLFADPRFQVAVWTSNIAANAQAILDVALTEEQRSRLVFVMSREHCALGPNYTSFKHLDTIYKRGFAPSHVVIVDDSDSKVVPPSKDNWIRIEEFEASSISIATDTALIDLQTTLANRSVFTK